VNRRATSGGPSRPQTLQRTSNSVGMGFDVALGRLGAGRLHATHQALASHRTDGLVLGLAGHVVLWPFFVPLIARVISRFGHWLAHGQPWVPLSLGHWSAIFSALSRKTHFSLHETTSQTINSLIFFKPEIHHFEYISFTALALLAYFVSKVLTFLRPASLKVCSTPADSPGSAL